MLRKCVFAFVVVTFSVGVLCADTFPALITKVDGNKVTFKKGMKGEDKKTTYDEKTTTMTAAKNVEVQAKKKGETMTIEGGLKGVLFSAEAISKSKKGGIPVIITTEGDSITKVMIAGGKGGKKKKDAQ
jgi:hypothetical protein